MKKNIFIILSLLAFLFTGCTVKTKTVAMVFEERDGSVSTESINGLNVYFQIEEVLSNRPDLKVIDRSKVDTVLQEQAFQQSDWSDGVKSAELGRALNADVIAFIVVYSDFYIVEFLNVNTFQKTTFRSEISKKGKLKNE